MKARLSRGASISIAVAAAVVSGFFLLFAFVIRSDFVQRGCHYTPSNEWIYTPNCTDAYNVGMFCSGVAVLGLAVLTWMIWGLPNV